MASGAVVEVVDVVADGGGAEVTRREVLVVDVLGLEGREGALGDGVPAVALRLMLWTKPRSFSVAT